MTWKLSFRSKEPSEMQKNKVGHNGHPRGQQKRVPSLPLLFLNSLPSGKVRLF